MSLEAFLKEYTDAGGSAKQLLARGVSFQTLRAIAGDTRIPASVRMSFMEVFAVPVETPSSAMRPSEAPPAPTTLLSPLLPESPFLHARILSNTLWFKTFNVHQEEAEDAMSHALRKADPDVDMSHDAPMDEEDEENAYMQVPASKRRRREAEEKEAEAAIAFDWSQLPPDVFDLIQRHSIRMQLTQRIQPMRIHLASSKMWQHFEHWTYRNTVGIKAGAATRLRPTQVNFALTCFMSELVKSIRIPRYSMDGIYTEDALKITRRSRAIPYRQNPTETFVTDIVDFRVSSALETRAEVSLALLARRDDGERFTIHPRLTLDLTSPEIIRLCPRADHWAMGHRVETAFRGFRHKEGNPDRGGLSAFGTFHTTTSLGLDPERLVREATEQLVASVGNEVDEDDDEEKVLLEYSLYGLWSGHAFSREKDGGEGRYYPDPLGIYQKRDHSLRVISQILEYTDWNHETILYDVRLDSPLQSVYEQQNAYLFPPTLEQLLHTETWKRQQGVLLTRSTISLDESASANIHPLAPQAVFATELDNLYPLTIRKLNKFACNVGTNEPWTDALYVPLMPTRHLPATTVAWTPSLLLNTIRTSHLDYDKQSPFMPILYGHATMSINSEVFKSGGTDRDAFVTLPSRRLDAMFSTFRTDADRIPIQRAGRIALDKLDHLLDQLVRGADYTLRSSFKRDLSACFAIGILPTRIAWRPSTETRLDLLEHQIMWGGVSQMHPEERHILGHPELLPHVEVYMNDILLYLEKANTLDQPTDAFGISILFSLDKFAAVTKEYAMDDEIAFETMLAQFVDTQRKEAENARAKILKDRANHADWAVLKEKARLAKEYKSNTTQRKADLDHYVDYKKPENLVIDPNVIGENDFIFASHRGRIRINKAELAPFHLRVIEKLGAGHSGTTYHVCVGDICDRVMKIGYIEPREIQTAQFMGAAGIGPIVYDHVQLMDWATNENVTALFMQRVDMTLEMWLDSGRSLTAEHAERVFALFRKAFGFKFIHGDVKLDNIGVTVRRAGNDYEIVDFYLIDFGTSYFQDVDGPYDSSKRRGGWLRTVPLIVDFADSWDERALLGTHWDPIVLLYYLETVNLSRMNEWLAFAQTLSTLCYNAWLTKKSWFTRQRAFPKPEDNPLRPGNIKKYMADLSPIQVRRISNASVVE